MPITVRQVDASVARPLRRRVLRAHQTIDELAAEDGQKHDLVYFAALEADRVVSVASLCREDAPWADGAVAGWRLHGMATEEGDRGRGVGTAVLYEVIRAVGARGGGLLWCNARIPAVTFYERAGFVIEGEGWVDPVLGPHVAMQRRVAAG